MLAEPERLVAVLRLGKARSAKVEDAGSTGETSAVEQDTASTSSSEESSQQHNKRQRRSSTTATSETRSDQQVSSSDDATTPRSAAGRSWSLLPGPTPVNEDRLITRIRTCKRVQHLYSQIFVPGNMMPAAEATHALAQVRHAALTSMQGVNYESIAHFRSEVHDLLRTHCGVPLPSVARAVAERLDRLVSGAQAADRALARARPKTLANVRDELFAKLMVPGMACLSRGAGKKERRRKRGGKEEQESSRDTSPNKAANMTAAQAFHLRREARRERRYGQGAGKAVPRRRQRPATAATPQPEDSDVSSWCDSSSSEEEDVVSPRMPREVGSDGEKRLLPLVPDPLVMLKQPPETWCKTGARDHHFVMEVGLPRSARRRLTRITSGISMVVELRYEDGEVIEQFPLQVLEDPLLRPGDDRWVVRARINVPKNVKGNRRFALFSDISPFEQREHGLHVAGVLSSPVDILAKPADNRDVQAAAAQDTTTPTSSSKSARLKAKASEPAALRTPQIHRDSTASSGVRLRASAGRRSTV